MTAAEAAKDDERIRVLLVDDQEICRVMGERILAAEGDILVDTADGGQEAIDAIFRGAEEGSRQYDIILLDVEMGSYGGDMVLRKLAERGLLRKRGNLRVYKSGADASKVAVIVVSKHLTLTDYMARMGAFDSYIKPIQEDLVQEVRRVHAEIRGTGYRDRLLEVEEFMLSIGATSR